MPVISAAEINSIRLKEQGSDPSTPASGYRSLYAKANGLYTIDSSSNVQEIGAGGALDDLTDVDAAAPDDGQVLTWSDGDSAWIPGDLPTAAANLLLGYNFIGASPTLSSSAFAWKGNVYTPTNAIKLHALVYFGTLVENATYQAMVCTINGSGVIQTVVASSATYTVPTGHDLTLQPVFLRFASPPTLSAGTAYVTMVGRTDGAANYALPIYIISAAAGAPFESTSGAAKYFRIADAAPTVSDTGEYATNNLPFYMGYLWEYV